MKRPVYENLKTKVYLSTWEDRGIEFKYPQNLIFPRNTYSPWEEIEFQRIYESISKHTLVDIYRAYELYNLASKLKSKSGDILEVGVWKGGTGFLLALAAGRDSTIHLCDTFQGVEKATYQDNVYKGGEHADTSVDTVIDLMNSKSLSNYEIHVGIFPEDTGHKLSDKNFKLCHIDVDVYQSAKDIFEWVWPRMIKGGIVVFDDYGFASCEGITQLVNELAQSHQDSLFIYNINGHGILIKQE